MMPNSVTKIKKDGVEFISSVDRVNYTIRELIFRANYDIARLLIYRFKQEARKSKHMSKLPKGRFKSIFQYWVRKRDADLQVGIKANTWYGVEGELGSNNQPRRGILRDTTFDNVGQIREITAQYISAVEDELKAIELIKSTEGVVELVNEQDTDA